MASISKGSAQVCAIRVARLSASCTHVPGANNAAASSAIIRVGSTPEYRTGEDFELANGCGQLCVTMKNADVLKRINLSLELCLRDPAMLELLTGATTYSDGTDIIGYSRRGIGVIAPASVSVEVWTKAVTTQNVCSPADGAGYGDAAWFRTIWPKATFTLGDVTFANEVATVALTGFAEANPNFGNGPFNDVPDDFLPLDPDSPEHTLLDPAGPPTLGSGYTATPVPSQA